MAATRQLPGRVRNWGAAILRTLTRPGAALAQLAGLLGGVLAPGANAATLAEERSEAMIHVYHGGGITASGPAFLVRKNIAEKWAVSGSYYVDAVSNASIDVVTTASPFRERRTAYSLGVDHLVRDAVVSLSGYTSTEPDYEAASTSLDIAQDIYGGMTTVALGFTNGRDKVGQRNTPGFIDTARHWQYRLGLTQILSPRWLASANLEVVADDGYLGSPYRAARVFGAAVPERNPRTRTSRALKLRSIADIGSRSALRFEYRYFWDTWDIQAHTLEAGVARYFGDEWLGDAFVRYYKQGKANFYSDNATSETLYVSRNRQLATFTSPSIGARLTRKISKLAGTYEVNFTGSLELKNFNYADFTDLRSSGMYRYNAVLLQVNVSAVF